MIWSLNTLRIYSGNIAKKKNNSSILKWSLCRPVSLASKLPNPAQPVLHQPKLLLPSPIVHTSGYPTPHFCVEEKQDQHSGNESFSQIGVRVHSSLPVRPASQVRLGLQCVRRRWVRGITQCLSPSKTHEGRLCLPHWEEEWEGPLTAQQRVAGCKMWPIF